MRGSPPTLTSLTAACPPAADGITSSSPRPTSTALRGGSVSGSKPARKASSSASTAPGTSMRRSISAADR